MSRLVWGATGTHIYETGIDRGVLYPVAGPGVIWKGLVGVQEGSGGAGGENTYLDGSNLRTSIAGEEFSGVLKALSTPSAFAPCDGIVSLRNGLFITQQPRAPFGMSYRTLVGNDVSEDLGYKIHLLYGITAAPSERENKTLTESPEPLALSWNLSSLPVAIYGQRPSAHVILNSRKLTAGKLLAIENALYGTVSTEPYLPTPVEILYL